MQQVFHPSGKLIAEITDERCYYSDDTLRQMVAAGYKVKVDGKIWRPKKKETK